MDFPAIDPIKTGDNITKLRKAAGLSVHDVQAAFGFNSPQAIYKWQNGTALPSVDNLVCLAALLRVRMDDTPCCPQKHCGMSSHGTVRWCDRSVFLYAG